MYLAANLAGLFLLQIVAALFIKWGSMAPQQYWWGFGLSNFFGAISVLMSINIYKVMKPSLALSICGGGTFILIQLAMWFVYKCPLGIIPSMGILMIAGGIVLVAMFK